MLKHHRLDDVGALKQMVKPVIFLINGPGGSGKDTAGHLLQAEFPLNSKVVKFAGIIKRVCAMVYGQENFDRCDASKEAKETPDDAFFGQTCRQVQINFSEKFLKVTHDDKIFGHFLAKEIDQRNLQGIDLFFVTDSGFRHEAEVLVDKYGADNVVLFRIHRPGLTFHGDSRNYITLHDLGVKCYDVQNTQSKEDLLAQMLPVVRDVMRSKNGSDQE